MSYADHLAANRRLCILKGLIDDEGHGNESVIELNLLALGHHAGMTREYVREQLRFLEKTGAIEVDYYRDRVMVAHITSRGVAIAEGRITVDGVARPALGER